jgi:hypothetical protein
MGITIETRVRRNKKMKDWVEFRWLDEHDRQVAWETFFKIIELHPGCADELRGEYLD